MEWVECILFLLAVWIFSIFSTKLLNLQERCTSCGQVSVEKTSILLGLKEFFAMLKIINFHYNFLMKFVRLHFFYYFNCTAPAMIVFFSSLSSFWDQFKQVISTIQVFWSFEGLGNWVHPRFYLWLTVSFQSLTFCYLEEKGQICTRIRTQECHCSNCQWNEAGTVY